MIGGGDTVFGQEAHLVTLVDRKIHFTLIGKVDSKKADTAAETMIYLLKRVSSVCTITLDNRCEFAAQEKVAEAVNADVFFAKPYASYQRGKNENTHGIIQRTYPKKNAFGASDNGRYSHNGFIDQHHASKSSRWE